MKRIGIKLFVQVTLVISVIVAGFNTFEVFRRQQEFTALLHAKAARVLQQLSIVLGMSLWNMDWEQVDVILVSYLGDPDILSIKVQERGNTVSSFGKNPKSLNLVNLMRNALPSFHYPGAFIEQGEILYNDEVLGVFEVTFSCQFVTSQMQNVLVNTVIFFVLLCTLLILPITSVMSKSVSQPVNELKRIFERVAGGDFEQEIDTSRPDEIGSLAKSFAILRDEIRAHMIELHNEIQERQRAEDALVSERNLLRTLIDNIPDSIYVKDTASRFLLSNFATARLMGASGPEELLGKTDFDFYPPHLAAQFYANEQELMRSGQSWHHEELICDSNGNPLWLLTTKVLLRGSQGMIGGMVGIGRNITEHKQAEKQIRTLNTELELRVQQRTAQLEQVNQELKNFAYIVSHDLKAPLRNISQLVNWLIRDYASAFDTQGKQYVDLLLSRVKRMDNLINGVLEYSRIGRGNDNEELIDLNVLLPEVVDILAPLPPIRVVVPPALPTLIGDRTRISQVFQNLIGNAIKFVDKPQGDITVGCRDEGDWWQFTISDNGSGIDPRDHERIFQMFQTVHPRDEIESTGVGLTIVKKIVEFYGGKIWVESEKGKGSIFFFTLPKRRKDL